METLNLLRPILCNVVFYLSMLSGVPAAYTSPVSQRHAEVNTVVEWSYVTTKDYPDPFNNVELDVVFAGPDGREYLVPAFWGGGHEWRVRFSAPREGTYRYRTECTDTANADLHNRQGTVVVTPYTGENPLYRHGALRISPDRRHLAHADGTPFLWLADSWWHGMTTRLAWPEDFQLLTRDRKDKGFSVIQFAVAQPCDIAPFDERGANEAGHPWDREYRRINPAYFDMTDLRIWWLVRLGLVPNIVGTWGYYLQFMGVEKAKRHWRYLVARYGAYPVVWTLAGEVTMPYYLSEDQPRLQREQIRGWAEVLTHLRKTDPYRRLVAAHAGPGDWIEPFDDPALLDITMLMSGHSGWESLPYTMRLFRRAYTRDVVKPILYGEVCFEGMFGGSNEKIQRFLFWANMLSGAAGHSYDADAIWQFNTRAQPFGASPSGHIWGSAPWEDAYRWPGAKHIGIGKQILERFEWWRFTPRQDWVEPAAGDTDVMDVYAAGIPGEVRVCYFPRTLAPWVKGMVVKNLEPDVRYRAAFFDPVTGAEYPVGPVTEEPDGRWPVPPAPILQDWVLVLETPGARRR